MIRIRRSGPACAGGLFFAQLQTARRRTRTLHTIGLGALLGSVLMVAAFPKAAHAGGLELLPGGTRSVARGGAVAARPEDPMAMLHNPAGLALLSGDRVMLNIDLAVHDMCFDPYGYYGWGVYSADPSQFGDPLDTNGSAPYATTPLPKVCNSGDLLPIPSIAWATHLTENLAFAIGMVAPTVIASVRYGREDGTIDIDGTAFPTPTRYQMIDQKAEAIAPAVALAYRFSQLLSIGANLQVLAVRGTVHTFQNETSGTQPSSDWRAEIVTSDYFIPTLTFAAHSKPIRELDLALAFRWVDSFDGSGEVTYETGAFHEGADTGPVPFKNDPIELTRVRIGLPWALTLGVRYAGLLDGRAGPRARDGSAGPRAREGSSSGDADPMASERWDVELDATYALGGHTGDNAIKPGDDVTIISRVAGGGSALTPTESLPEVTLDRHQLDSVAVRLGGSFSFIPQRFAVHAGTFFESRGLEASYASIESFAFARVGVGAGVGLRFGPVDVFAAYGHIFQETLEVVSPEHQNVEDHDPNVVTSGFDKRVGGSFNDANVRVGGVVLEDPDEPSTGDATAKLQQNSPLPSPARPERIINAGKYTASFDVLSVGVQYRY